MKPIAIITQARTTSKRFPRKILQEINGKSIIEFHLERLMWSKLPVIVATTSNKEDNAIIDICNKNKIPFFRGEEYNVLNRFYYTAKHYEISTIIRVTTDCPLIDGRLIADGLIHFSNCDYLSNTIKRTFPRGMDFEIFTFKALEQAFLNSIFFHEKEHVTPYIHSTNHKTFRIKNYSIKENYSDYRLTLDTKDDLELIKELILKFECNKFSYKKIISIINKNNYLADINKHVNQKEDNIYFRQAEVSDFSMVNTLLNESIEKQSHLVLKSIRVLNNIEGFIEKLQKDKFFIFTLFDLVPIGFVLLEKFQGRCAEISIALEKKHREKNYSSKMINLISDYAFEQLAIETLLCYIIRNNIKALKTFYKAGYTLIKLITYNNNECFELRRTKQKLTIK